MIFMGGWFSKYIQRALKRGDAMLDDSYGNRVSTNSIEALENILANAKGPVSDLTKKVARAYLYMQDANWLSASELFTSVVREHARFGGSNAQRDLLDFSLAACLLHQGRKREAKKFLQLPDRGLCKKILSQVYIERRFLRFWR